jgi:hypothetical protein
MASEIQLLANRANAQLSTGPVTADGKQRSSRNAAALGLFSASAFIRPDENQAYRKFSTAWNAHLAPDGPVEEALVAELVQAAWRLRRCTTLETATWCAPGQDAPTPEDLDRMQASIDRARATSLRALQRNLTDLRRIQTERQMRNEMRNAVPGGHQAHAHLGAASIGDIENFIDRIAHRYPAERAEKQSQSAPAPEADSAKRSQSDPSPTPRSAPCPCGSGEKYKRCCGKNAPPVLSHAV